MSRSLVHKQSSKQIGNHEVTLNSNFITMRTFVLIALFALFAIAMAQEHTKAEEKKDLQASPSLLYGGLGYGGLYGPYGLYGLHHLRLAKLGLLYGGLGYGIGGFYG